MTSTLTLDLGLDVTPRHAASYCENNIQRNVNMTHTEGIHNSGVAEHAVFGYLLEILTVYTNRGMVFWIFMNNGCVYSNCRVGTR